MGDRALGFRVALRLPTRAVKPLILGLMLGLSGGCSDNDFDDLQQYVTEVKSRKKDPVPPLPVVKTVEPFLFHAEQLRDPFMRPKPTEEKIDTAASSAIRPDLNRPKEELESYELDTLRMVGTVAMGGGLWGLVKATDGTIRRVRNGNYMGRNFGRIVAVRSDRIELVEIIPERPGYWQERQAALDLIEPSTGDAGEARR